MEKLIFITNDDGINSPGLRAAVESVADLGEIIIAAPTSQQTAMSRSLWAGEGEYLKEIPFNLEGKKIKAYHCDASPAMIVQHAFNVFFKERKPHLVISGINYGENLGYDCMLSGTIGAAFQGAAAGVPALAISMQTEIKNHYYYGKVNWNAAEHFTRFFSEKILSEQLPQNCQVLKVDIPDSATKLTPWKFTKVAKQHYFFADLPNSSVTSKISDSRIKVNEFDGSLSKESDIYAIHVDRVISVSPLNMDLSANQGDNFKDY